MQLQKDIFMKLLIEKQTKKLCLRIINDSYFFPLFQVFFLSVSLHPLDGGKESHHPERLGATDDQSGQGESHINKA